ncbi:hypothetical protein DAPPUDRAFT_253353 [Daphnia pulex]|uniref:Uncharacterized protein n=1 Tax=Daphnia pulex TaxID=6669 RepID=E9H4M6_DAPPU|nr:hypothetical protein DAPPUDRAFT_253353 [Daphnia pulex]|eukprot:EFX73171.1 hypothetical protein DAPPUDRAFT_253353 [Daphnia pulex]
MSESCGIQSTGQEKETHWPIKMMKMDMDTENGPKNNSPYLASFILPALEEEEEEDSFKCSAQQVQGHSRKTQPRKREKKTSFKSCETTASNRQSVLISPAGIKSPSSTSTRSL